MSVVSLSRSRFNIYLSSFMYPKPVIRRGLIRPSFARVYRHKLRLERQKYLSSRIVEKIKTRYIRSKYLVVWLYRRMYQRSSPRVLVSSSISRLGTRDWLAFNWGMISWLYQTPDTVTNPLWGQTRRGFPKLLFHARIREYTNVYLRPRWYRRARLHCFMTLLRYLGEVAPGSLCSLYTGSVFVSTFRDVVRTRLTTFRFYLRKRWWLSQILQHFL